MTAILLLFLFYRTVTFIVALKYRYQKRGNSNWKWIRKCYCELYVPPKSL